MTATICEEKTFSGVCWNIFETDFTLYSIWLMVICSVLPTWVIGKPKANMGKPKVNVGTKVECCRSFICEGIGKY
jgi:hypothetical protein